MELRERGSVLRFGACEVCGVNLSTQECVNFSEVCLVETGRAGSLSGTAKAVCRVESGATAGRVRVRVM